MLAAMTSILVATESVMHVPLTFTTAEEFPFIQEFSAGTRAATRSMSSGETNAPSGAPLIIIGFTEAGPASSQP